MRTTNGVVMVFDARKWLIWVCLALFSCPGYGQAKPEVNVPPMIVGDWVPIGKSFRLTHRQETNTMCVVTIKYKISSKGMLDTLFISPNTPVALATYIKQHLMGLNGQWRPQITNGKPAGVSKWLMINLYIAGFIEGEGNFDSCPQKQYSEFLAAYEREYDLFGCYAWGKNSFEWETICSVRYIESADHFLYMPWLSTVRH